MSECALAVRDPRPTDVILRLTIRIRGITFRVVWLSAGPCLFVLPSDNHAWYSACLAVQLPVLFATWPSAPPQSLHIPNPALDFMREILSGSTLLATTRPMDELHPTPDSLRREWEFARLDSDASPPNAYSALLQDMYIDEPSPDGYYWQYEYNERPRSLRAEMSSLVRPNEGSATGTPSPVELQAPDTILIRQHIDATYEPRRREESRTPLDSANALVYNSPRAQLEVPTDEHRIQDLRPGIADQPRSSTRGDLPPWWPLSDRREPLRRSRFWSHTAEDAVAQYRRSNPAQLSCKTPLFGPEDTHTHDPAGQTPRCCVCLENEATHAMVPCLHQCVCFSCAFSMCLDRVECPVCTGPVCMVNKVYT